MATKIVKCSSCGTENTGLENFCRNCGTTLNDPFQNQSNQPNQQMQMPYNQGSGTAPGTGKKMLAGILGIVLGVLGLGFGIHKFVLGYNQEGVILLVGWLASIFLTIITCGIAFPLMLVPSIISIIEGIMYLTKSDEEFVNTYITNKRPWF